jgi:hypothetical protein
MCLIYILAFLIVIIHVVEKIFDESIITPLKIILKYQY